MFSVTEQVVQGQAIGITQYGDVQLAIYRTDGAVSKAVKDALATVASMRRAIADAQQVLTQAQQDYQRIKDDQDRVRQNLQSVHADNEYYQRLQAKLLAQENQVDALDTTIDTARATVDQKQKALNDFIAQLTIP